MNMSVTKIKNINNIIGRVGKGRVIFFNDLISKAGVKQDELKAYIAKGHIKGLDRIDFGDRDDFIELSQSVMLRDHIEPSTSKKVERFDEQKVVNVSPIDFLNVTVKARLVKSINSLVKQLKVLNLDGVLAIMKYNDSEVIACLEENLRREVLEYSLLVSDIRKYMTPKASEKLLTDLIVTTYTEVIR